MMDKSLCLQKKAKPKTEMKQKRRATHSDASPLSYPPFTHIAVPRMTKTTPLMLCRGKKKNSPKTTTMTGGDWG